MSTGLKAVARWGLVLGAALLACAAGLAFSSLHLLRPAPGEWAETVTWGRWQHRISMPTLVRMASHPFTLGLLQGHTLNTRFGPVRWAAGARPGTWVIVCAPCALARAELGRERIVLTRAEFTLERDAGLNLHGRFALGDAAQAVRGRWRARIEPGQAEVTFDLPATPMAHAFGLFGSAVPEAGRARIEGSLALTARLRFPSRELLLAPRIEGFSVAGLGTEALAGALPACAASSAGAPFGPWLPRAVIAAEDQRFHEHTGYDLAEIVAAWSGNANATRGDAARPRGASTLSQQLAKMIYTGDQPSPARKLRELLYAVELDRTLGKARVLGLYLALAPWGDGQCGAHAAALHLLGRRAADLTPVEAAWLASLLRNPNAMLARAVQTGAIDVDRVAAVIEAMRPMAAPRRAAARALLDGWRPAWLGANSQVAQRKGAAGAPAHPGF